MRVWTGVCSDRSGLSDIGATDTSQCVPLPDAKLPASVKLGVEGELEVSQALRDLALGGRAAWENLREKLRRRDRQRL